ncbi:MAG TPA: hypothetical protein VLC10_03860 [Patescibacteria group bacterium]|nr:hypothetical protein [Patescibacteria group bacterium]
MNAPRPSREPAPEREPAPVISIFSGTAGDRRFFGRIQYILAARLAKGRLFLELYVDGPALPANYFHTLTCTVEDPLAGVNAHVKIEAVKTDGHHVAVRSEPLACAPNATRDLSPNAVVRVTSPSGQMMQNLLQPLLDAKP